MADPQSLLFDGAHASWLNVAMKRVRIAQLKDNLSEHLRSVERGEEIEVTHRNRPIARIVPLPIQGPVASLIRPTRSFLEVRDLPFPAANWKIDSTTLLIEERQDR